MKKMKLATAIAISILLICGTAYAIPLDGSLTWSATGSPIFATASWASGSTSISWHITGPVDGKWTYEYTWNTSEKNLSHIIIEMTPGTDIVPGSVYKKNGSDWVSYSNFSVDTTQGFGNEGNSNPGIPELLKGIKVGSENVTSLTFKFESTQAPVWGDFYAKDGTDKVGEVKTDIYAYNTGFTVNDVDPLPDQDSSNHIVRPDGSTGVTIPEPGTMLLLGLGLLGLGISRKKK